MKQKAVYTAVAGAVGTTALVLAPELAMAASYVPDGVLTTMTTNVTDTFEEVQTWLWAIFPIVALGWFAFNQSRKAAGKFGGR